MAIKVDNANRTVGCGHAPEEWQGDRVIATKGNDSRQCSTSFRKPFLFSVGERQAGQQCVVALFDLLDRIGIIISDRPSACNGNMWTCGDERGHRNVSTIQHFSPAVERICIQWDIVSAAETHFT